MKKAIIIYVLLLVSFSTKAQTYDASNSLERRAIVQYTKDSRGIFKKQENVSLQEVSGVITCYGYNSKLHELYLLTEYSNCIVIVNDDLAKTLKKSKSIPQVKGNDLMPRIVYHLSELEKKIEKLNTNRIEQIKDSLAQAQADSLEKAKQNEKKKREAYRKAHEWRWLPVGKVDVGCSLCDYTAYYKDSIYICGIIRDTLYHASLEEGKLGFSYIQYHMTPIPNRLKNKDCFLYHVEAFSDSLASPSLFNKDVVEIVNDYNYFGYVEKLIKEAPYGFVDSWGWNDKYSEVTMSLKYTNLNKKTIKYIDVYFRITNDVGDVRKTGVFKGTGPVEEFGSGSWDWDSSRYYVAGDASQMSITQIILTYMDGTKVTLPKNKIHFN